MLKIVQGKTHELKDVELFLELINIMNEQALKDENTFFNSVNKIAISRAPGRLDVMGGIADYSGSTVLQLPIKEATLAAVQQTEDNVIRIISLTGKDSNRESYFKMRIEDFFKNNNPIDYKSAHTFFSKENSRKWAAYIAGVFLVLIKEKNIDFLHGANIFIYSDIHESKGVGSSAALEVAAMTAICRTFDIELGAIELAILCQKVENFVAGIPCGLMDQMVSNLGKKNMLMNLNCQPAELKPFVQIPDKITFWGLDSGIKHSLFDSDYTPIRIGAFIGQRIISNIIKKEKHFGITFNYLANITPRQFEKYFKNQLPIKLTGKDFIKNYQNTFDTVTEVNPDFEYNILHPTAHPIYENCRTIIFRKLLNKKITEETCVSLGEQMYLSHESYSACGLKSSSTDRLVSLVKEMGQTKGLYGAKISSGGNGGTVVILGRKDAEHIIEEIIKRYTNETGYRPFLFTGSSIGAHEFGSILLKDI